MYMKKEKRTVLIVDDSILILERMIPLMAEIENISFVVHAASYKEGLEVLSCLTPDLVLLDINLPDKSGIELLRVIRERQLEIAVLMISNNTRYRLMEQQGTAEAIIRAQEDERTRIGHELHDNINQILVSGKMYLSHLQEESSDFGAVKEKITELLELAIEVVRTLSKEMVLPEDDANPAGGSNLLKSGSNNALERIDVQCDQHFRQSAAAVGHLTKAEVVLKRKPFSRKEWRWANEVPGRAGWRMVCCN